MWKELRNDPFPLILTDGIFSILVSYIKISMPVNVSQSRKYYKRNKKRLIRQYLLFMSCHYSIIPSSSLLIVNSNGSLPNRHRIYDNGQ